jgi:hypothetical protein
MKSPLFRYLQAARATASEVLRRWPKALIAIIQASFDLLTGVLILGGPGTTTLPSTLPFAHLRGRDFVVVGWNAE